MPKKQDVWSEGSGLFDLNNLKSGDKTLLETKTNAANATNLLATGGPGAKTDDIWGGLGNLSSGSS